MTSTAAAALGPVVDALVAEPLGGLWPEEVQALIAAVGPQVQRLQGWLNRAVGELPASLPTADGGSRSSVGWVAQVLRESPPVVGRDRRVAEALRQLPLVAGAVLDGTLTQPQAAVLARLVGVVPAADLTEAEPALVEVASGCTPAELAQYVRHLVATHCEPALEAEEAAGQAARYLQHTRRPDGTLRGRFVLSAEDSEVLLTVLEPLSRRQGSADDRSAGQRRADALVELCAQAARHGDLPDAGGQRPQLTYVLPADWAAGQAARAACTDCRLCGEHRPASFADTVLASLPAPRPPGGSLTPGPAGAPTDPDLLQAAAQAATQPDGSPTPDAVPAEHACAIAAWSGPQTRARIETLLCDARLSRVLLDPTGQVRTLHALTDTVTAAQRRALAARDLGCAARGCTRPPAACDAHHLIALADQGPTALHNLVLLCRRHHVQWHLGKTTLADLHVPWLKPALTGAGPPAA